MAGDGTAIGSAIITSVKRMKDLESKSNCDSTYGWSRYWVSGASNAAEAARDLE